MTDMELRFWSKVRIGDGCWEWTAGKLAAGYGRFGLSRITLLAHRVAWTFARGPIPDGMQVLHRCDNPPCVRPGHLFLGTHADNMADKKAKGRTSRLPGERHCPAKLTDEQAYGVILAARAGERQRVIARRLGVSETTISYIVNRKRWTHVSAGPVEVAS